MLSSELKLLRIPVLALLSVVLTAFVFRNAGNVTENDKNRKEMADSLHFALKNKLQASPLTYGWYDLFREAVHLRQENKYETAWARFRDALKYTPEYPGFYEEALVTVNSYNKYDEFTRLTESLIKTPFYKNYALSLAEFKFGDPATAESLAVEAVKIPSSETESIYSAINYAMILRAAGKYDDAVRILEKTEADFAGSYNYLLRYRARVLNATGSLYLLLGDYEKAGALYKAALEAAGKNSDKTEIAKASVNLGIISDEEGDLDGGYKLLKSAYNTAGMLDDDELRAIAASELGVHFTYKSDIVTARKFYSESYNLFVRVFNKGRLGILCSNIGRLYGETGNYGAALYYFEEGLRYKNYDLSGAFLNLTGLGDIYSNLGNYAEALKYYDEAEKLFKGLESSGADAEISLGRGALLYNLGRYKLAEETFAVGEKAAVKAGDDYLTADLKLKRAHAQMKLGDVKNVTDNLNSAITVFNFYTDRAKVYESYLLEAEMFFDAGDDAGLLRALAGIEAMEGYADESHNHLQFLLLRSEYQLKNSLIKEARLNLKEAEKIALKTRNYVSLADIYMKMGEAEILTGAGSEVTLYFDKALESLEKLNNYLYSNSEIQIEYFSNYVSYYKRAAEYYFGKGDYTRAFLALDRSRSRNSLQNLFNIKLQSVMKDRYRLEEFYDNMWRLNHGLVPSSREDALRKKTEAVISEVLLRSPELREFITPGPASFTVLNRSILTDNEYFLSVSVIKGQPVFFVVNKGTVSAYKKDFNSDSLKAGLEKITPYFSAEIKNGEFNLNQDLFAFNTIEAYRFYKTFLSDVISSIPEGAGIIVSQEPELTYIPLEFLVTDDPSSFGAYNYSRTKFMVSRNVISYAPSLLVYANLKSRESHPVNKILLMGDPRISASDEYYSSRRGALDQDELSLRSANLYPLMHSRDEVEKIDGILNAGETYLSENASETNFKKLASGAEIIHLSTHSFLFKDQPLIVFSNTNDTQNDGFLEVGETVKLNLKTELVTLSSCRSGLGRIDKAEGILGMQKAFFDAGARSTLVSLWDVSDKYTSVFMELFYKSLREGKNKSEALSIAKKEFIEKYSANPYYWSAFILAGNTSGLVITDSERSVLYTWITYGFLILITAVAIFMSYRLIRVPAKAK